MEESSIFAFSAASRTRWVAILSLRMSTPDSFWNSAAIHSVIGVVHVGAAELRVAARREDLEDAVPEIHDRDIERSPAQVEDEDLLVLPGLVEAVGEARPRSAR